MAQVDLRKTEAPAHNHIGGGTRERTVIVLSLAARAPPAATARREAQGEPSPASANDPVDPLFESERNRIQ